MKLTTLARRALAASFVVLAAACAGDAEDADDAGPGENTILPAEDQTGGVGDMGTGTGTAAPGSDEPATSVGPDTTTGGATP